MLAQSAVEGSDHSDLSDGLSEKPLSIPSKYFYDDRGSALFDEICDLPEYYLTRSELALLEGTSTEIARITQPAEVVELGSGTARKTRTLLDAVIKERGDLRYVPVDISGFALEAAAESLETDLPGIRVEWVQCDYTESLAPVRPGRDCLALFLGSTIGNFDHEQGVELLTDLRSRFDRPGWFLLGVDLVKTVEVLEAAYNDTRGVTEDFNKNILNVVNRETGGDFDPADFDHLAFFNDDESQIEMHLVANRPVEVRLAELDLEVSLDQGEAIRTEISRKFTRESTHELLVESGFAPERWFAADDDGFALALARADGTEVRSAA
jgi:L-histidine N-alpha-methyltransferase